MEGGSQMSIIASAICDQCGRKASYNHVGKTHIKRWLREEGWSFGKKDLCPICNKRGTLTPHQLTYRQDGEKEEVTA